MIAFAEYTINIKQIVKYTINQSKILLGIITIQFRTNIQI